jgi:catalase
MRQTIGKGKVNYFPNSLGGGYPKMASAEEGGYVHYTEKVEGHKIRERSKSFKDHFSQATLFWNSMSAGEKKRIVQACHFELGKVESKEVRIRMVNEIFNNISHELATLVAEGIGIDPPSGPVTSMVKDAAVNIKDKVMHAVTPGKSIEDAPSMSIDRSNKPGAITSRKVAILIDNGFSYKEVMSVKQALKAQGAQAKIVSMFKGTLKSATGEEMEVDKSHITTGSIMFDAVFVPGGKESVEKLKKQGDALHFINEAFKHGKPIGATNEGADLLLASSIPQVVTIAAEGQNGKAVSEKGIVTLRNPTDFTAFNEAFIKAMAQHRHILVREERAMVPA